MKRRGWSVRWDEITNIWDEKAEVCAEIVYVVWLSGIWDEITNVYWKIIIIERKYWGKTNLYLEMCDM
jgi:hypothetical protein